MGLDDLLRSGSHENLPDPSPAVPLRAIVLSVNDGASSLTVKIPTRDGGRHAYRAFGFYPGAQAGDEVRVMADEFDDFVLVAGPWRHGDAW